MRSSLPMPARTEWMSAPMGSHSLASSFMKEMRVASIELAAYLVSSLDRRLITITRSLDSCRGRYISRISSPVSRSSTPITTR